MIRRDYLPTSEARLVEWTYTFATHISNDWADFGLTEEQATDYQTTRNRFIALYNKAQDDGTRTRVVVNEKNVAKRTLINATRMLVRVCEAWPQMTNAKRILLGITERRPRASRVPAPRSRPFVKFLDVEERDVLIALQSSSSDRTRPAGVASANIFVAYGEVAPESADGWELYTGTTRSRLTLTLDKVETATRAWISAQWLNGRKEAGPGSTPVSIDLAAMSVVPQVQTTKLKKAA